MIRTTISEVKNRLSAYLRRVKRGETVLIMDRKTPVAWLVPVSQGVGAQEERGLYEVDNRNPEMEEEAKIARLESAGVIVRRNPESPWALLRRWRPGISARLVEAVLEEREEEYRDGHR